MNATTLTAAAPSKRQPLPPDVLEQIEAAYRRGYAQAAYIAARDAAQGHDLKAWAAACAMWRYAAKYGPRKWAPVGTPPPEAWEVNQ